MRFILSFILLLSLSASAKPTASIAVPAEWKEIDLLNKELKKVKKPLTLEKFASTLKRGVHIAQNEALDQHYQRVREKAFLRNNFKEAEGYEKRAKPAFYFSFSGDNDLHELDYKFFHSLTAAGSAEREFLDLYKKYAVSSHVDLTKEGLDSKECYLPFHLPKEEVAGIEKDELTKEMEILSIRLKDGYLQLRLKALQNCLNPKPPVEGGNMVDLPSRQKIVQAIINGKELAPYLHPEKEGRVPFVVSEALVGNEIELSKFGRKVKMASELDLSGAYLRFLTFHCNAFKYCNFAFEYPVEGIRGSGGAFVNADGSVGLEKVSVTESEKP